MTFIGKLFAADPHRVGLSAKRTMVGSLVALVLIVAPGGVAAADSASGTQGQIAALQQQIASGAASIHSATEAYQQANLQAASLSQQMATDTATLTSMRATMSKSEGALRSEALRSYTGEQPTETYGDLGGSGDPAVRAEYLLVASGNVADSVDQLKVEQQQVHVQQQTVTREQQANATALRQAAAARSSALGQASGEQAKLDQLQSLLQSEVAAQAAAQAQAAAAQRAAPTPSTPPAATPSTQGAPVNGGLVSTVQSVVGAPAPSPAPAPAPPPVTAPTGSGGGASGDWLQLRECESGDNYQENTGNGFFGAYQFSQATWTGLGYPGEPDQEPPAMQDAAAMTLQARSGWGQWPACSAALGLT